MNRDAIIRREGTRALLPRESGAIGRAVNAQLSALIGARSEAFARADTAQLETTQRRAEIAPAVRSSTKLVRALPGLRGGGRTEGGAGFVWERSCRFHAPRIGPRSKAKITAPQCTRSRLEGFDFDFCRISFSPSSCPSLRKLHGSHRRGADAPPSRLLLAG